MIGSWYVFWDLLDFCLYGRMLLHGQYYARYPLPTLGAFALLGLLPDWLALIVLDSLSFLAFISVFKRRALLWLLYVPVIEVFAYGQVDLIAFWLLKHASPVSLALLTLKPQLFPFAIPTLIKNRNMWKPFAFWCGVLYIPITLIRPGWIGEWIRGVDDGRLAAGTSASLWPVPVLAIAFCILLAIRFNWKALASALNPAFRTYDYVFLAGTNTWLIPLSWVTLWLWKSVVGRAWPVALLGVAEWAIVTGLLGRLKSLAKLPRPPT